MAFSVSTLDLVQHDIQDHPDNPQDRILHSTFEKPYFFLGESSIFGVPWPPERASVLDPTCTYLLPNSLLFALLLLILASYYLLPHAITYWTKAASATRKAQACYGMLQVATTYLVRAKQYLHLLAPKLTLICLASTYSCKLLLATTCYYILDQSCQCNPEGSSLLWHATSCYDILSTC